MTKKQILKAHAAAKRKVGSQFTDAEKKLIQSAALAVWDECAYDLLQLKAEETGKSINSVTVSRAEVMEIALDAGRCEDRLRRGNSVGVSTHELLNKMESATYEDLIAVVRPVFTFARYGM